MAGAGYKLFNTGDVLTAAQVNTYLQEQAVMRFANAAARTTALSGVLAEGMMSYLDDTNSVEVYNGSAWVSVSSDQTPLTTKGDLFTYSTTDARLAVGNNGETLVADSSTATGLRWGRASFVGCGLYKSGTQAITTGTWTSITFDTEEYDTNAFHSTVSNTSRFTVPSGYAGKYAIAGTVYFAANSGNNLIRMAKNGSLFNYIFNAKKDNTQGAAYPISGIYDLAVADYLELQVFQDTGANLNVEGTSTTTRWQIVYLGA